MSNSLLIKTLGVLMTSDELADLFLSYGKKSITYVHTEVRIVIHVEEKLVRGYNYL